MLPKTLVGFLILLNYCFYFVEARKYYNRANNDVGERQARLDTPVAADSRERLVNTNDEPDKKSAINETLTVDQTPTPTPDSNRTTTTKPTIFKHGLKTKSPKKPTTTRLTPAPGIRTTTTKKPVKQKGAVPKSLGVSSNTTTTRKPKPTKGHITPKAKPTKPTIPTKGHITPKAKPTKPTKPTKAPIAKTTTPVSKASRVSTTKSPKVKNIKNGKSTVTESTITETTPTIKQTEGGDQTPSTTIQQ